MTAFELKMTRVLRWGWSVLFILSSLPMQANAEPAFTFSLEGTAAAEANSVLSYSVSGSELALVKLIDSFSDDLSQAASNGTTFATGQLAQYDGLVSPETLVKIMDFSSMQISAFTAGGISETVTFIYRDLTVTAGPASVPEPSTIWLFLASSGLFAVRRLKGPRSNPDPIPTQRYSTVAA